MTNLPNIINNISHTINFYPVPISYLYYLVLYLINSILHFFRFYNNNTYLLSVQYVLVAVLSKVICAKTNACCNSWHDSKNSKTLFILKIRNQREKREKELIMHSCMNETDS